EDDHAGPGGGPQLRAGVPGCHRRAAGRRLPDRHGVLDRRRGVGGLDVGPDDDGLRRADAGGHDQAPADHVGQEGHRRARRSLLRRERRARAALGGPLDRCRRPGAGQGPACQGRRQRRRRGRELHLPDGLPL
ncbi:MAG: hypothetical protein AVDCRST_MAG76-2318, partial [uncultured Acidimicrobiales bacterium]